MKLLYKLCITVIDIANSKTVFLVITQTHFLTRKNNASLFKLG